MRQKMYIQVNLHLGGGIWGMRPETDDGMPVWPRWQSNMSNGSEATSVNVGSSYCSDYRSHDPIALMCLYW